MEKTMSPEEFNGVCKMSEAIGFSVRTNPSFTQAQKDFILDTCEKYVAEFNEQVKMYKQEETHGK